MLSISHEDFPVERYAKEIWTFVWFLLGKKLAKYLPTEEFFDKGLYMFDVGQNDIAGAFYSKTLDQIIASIPLILVEFETGIKVGLNWINCRFF